MSLAGKVSICLPVFNGEKFLSEAIASALAQSYENFELIVCDDGSSDSSWEIIESCALKDKRIIASRNDERKGLFENYNLCMSKASGEFIKPFAQDDLLFPETLTVMTDALRKNPGVVLVASPRKILDQDGAMTESAPSYPGSGRIAGKNAVLTALKTRDNVIGEPVCVLFPSKFIGKGFDSNYYSLGDIEFCLRILAQGDLFYLQEACVAFRRHEQSTSTRLINRMNWPLDFVRLGHAYKDLLPEIGATEEKYMLETISRVALEFKDQVTREEIDGRDLEGFKEVAYYALLALGRNEQERLYYRAKCEGMTRSASWKLTKPLRKLKAAVRHMPKDAVED